MLKRKNFKKLYTKKRNTPEGEEYLYLPLFARSKTPFTYDKPQHLNAKQHDYPNGQIASLFFNRDAQIERFVHVRRILRRVEQQIARACCPYVLGQEIYFHNYKTRDRQTMFVSKILFTPYAPYFRLYGNAVGSHSIVSERKLPLNRIQAVTSDSKPIANYAELVAKGLIQEDPEDTVFDEYAVPAIVHATNEGEKIYRENPKLAELLVETYVTMPRTFRK